MSTEAVDNFVDQPLIKYLKGTKNGYFC